ncbi:MAG: hypothetical protein P8J91_14960 [Pirellulaceae bacterium]|nr:hypothetical protein [Pirellulaceae bacterium]
MDNTQVFAQPKSVSGWLAIIFVAGFDSKKSLDFFATVGTAVRRKDIGG